jgi:hypothetical protein
VIRGEEEGVAVGDIQLFFVVHQRFSTLLERLDQTFADGFGQLLVLAFGVVEFLLRQAVELVD